MTDASENFDVILTKYKTAGEVSAKAMRTVIDAATEGKTVLEARLGLTDYGTRVHVSPVRQGRQMLI